MHGKKRRRRQVRPRADSSEPVAVTKTDTNESATRSGRLVRKPIYYQVDYSSYPDRTAFQQGEVVRNVIRLRHVSSWRAEKV